VNVIPTVTMVVPSTLAASLAPKAPLAIAQPVSAASTSAKSTSRDEEKKLIKDMEDMSIQTTDMNKFKEKVRSLETNYKLAKIMHKNEVQKSTRMSERLKAMEKDLTLKEPLGEAKELLWANIIDSVNDIWPSIQVIFKQVQLINMATEAIQREKEELGEILEEATGII